MTWQDILAPVMVIGLMAIMFFAIVTSEGTSQGARRGRKRFPPTPREGRRRGVTDAARYTLAVRLVRIVQESSSRLTCCTSLYTRVMGARHEPERRRDPHLAFRGDPTHE